MNNDEINTELERAKLTNYIYEKEIDILISENARMANELDSKVYKVCRAIVDTLKKPFKKRKNND